MLLLFHSFLTDALLAILQYLSWLLPAIAYPLITSDWSRQSLLLVFFLKKSETTHLMCVSVHRDWSNKPESTKRDYYLLLLNWVFRCCWASKLKRGQRVQRQISFITHFHWCCCSTIQSLGIKYVTTWERYVNNYHWIHFHWWTCLSKAVDIKLSLWQFLFGWLQGFAPV